MGRTRDPLIALERDIPFEMLKTGVVDAIFTDKDMVQMLSLLREATTQADARNEIWYIVRETDRLFCTNVHPMDTRILDALYVFEVPPVDRRAGEVNTALAALARALPGMRKARGGKRKVLTALPAPV